MTDEGEPLTLRGWLKRLETAAMQFVRGGETAEGWTKLLDVEQQALEFLAQQIPCPLGYYQHRTRGARVKVVRCERTRRGFRHAVEYITIGNARIPAAELCWEWEKIGAEE